MTDSNKARWIVWAAIVLVVMNISSLATVYWQQHLHKADSEYRTGQHKPGQPGELLVRELEFTEDQAQELRALQDQHFRFKRSEQDRIQDARSVLAAELAADETDANRVQQAATDIGRIQAGLEAETFAHFLEIKKICTPAQAVLLVELFAEMMPPPGHRRPGHRPPGGAEHRPPPPVRH